MRKQGIFADLFAGVNNEAWDLGRILSFLAMLPLFISAGWNLWRGEAIDISSLGVGIAAVVTACAVLIAAKDYTNTNAISQAKQDQTAAVTADKIEPGPAPTPTVTVKVEPSEGEGP